MFVLPRLLSIVLFIFLMRPQNLVAQTDIAQIKHKPRILRGEWQLVRTYTDKSFHDIEKSEYDAVIRIKRFHHYEEEVWYEGYHWIIQGKWSSKRKRDSLCFTKRAYTYGKLEEKPQDIRYSLSELSKEYWTGESLAEGEKVNLRYKRIALQPKQKKSIK
jgi:hypothetical protein